MNQTGNIRKEKIPYVSGFSFGEDRNYVFPDSFLKGAIFNVLTEMNWT